MPAGGLSDLMLFLESPGISVNVRVFEGATWIEQGVAEAGQFEFMLSVPCCLVCLSLGQLASA